jgi:hypothetical protein
METFWWRAIYAVTRAEAMLRAGDERAGEALSDAEAIIGDHRYARGILLRARGLRDGDEAPIRAALTLFREIGCPYQAARTGWLLGDMDRTDAEHGFAALGATLPTGESSLAPS